VKSKSGGGYSRPHPEGHHSATLSAIDRMHAARNNDTGGGMRESPGETEKVSGGTAFTDPGPKGKGSGIQAGNADVKAIGKVAAGRIEDDRGSGT
jgi:hypothetical protein